MAAENPVHDEESHPCPVPVTLGGKKWVENLVRDGRIDPHPCIADRHTDCVSGLEQSEPAGILLTDAESFKGDGENTARGHGIPGVDAEIEEDLGDL